MPETYLAPIHQTWQVFMVGKNVYVREDVRVMRIPSRRQRRSKRLWKPDLTGFRLIRPITK